MSLFNRMVDSKKILLLGSGRKHLITGDIRCYPSSLKHKFKELISNTNNTVVCLDIDETMEPDNVADVTKDTWWQTVEYDFDIVIDTISHIGPHTKHNEYVDVFKNGVKHILVGSHGTFYGFYDIDKK